MTVAATHLTTGGSDTDAASYATASISPTANRLVLAWVFSNAAVSPEPPTLSGNGLTWVEVDTVTVTNPRLTLFRAMGSPSAGTVTIDHDGQTQTSCLWSIAQLEYVDTFGADGAGAVNQSATGEVLSATSLTATLATFGHTDNATVGGMVVQNAANPAVGSGFTQLGEAATIASTINSQWRANSDTSVDWSWAGATQAIGIAAEIRAAENGWGVGAVPLGF